MFVLTEIHLLTDPSTTILKRLKSDGTERKNKLEYFSSQIKLFYSSARP